MIKGYKYYLSEAAPDKTSIDNSIESFNSTMGYEELDLKNAEDFLKRIFAGGNIECHNALVKVLDKNKLVVGLGGGGCGEHEFFLHQKGYDIVASDIIPDLGKSLTKVDPTFRHLTIDAFKDDFDMILKNKLNVINRDYDVLMSGMDCYFDDAQLISLLSRINTLISKNSKLVFILCYRDYLFAKLIEFIIKQEGKIKSILYLYSLKSSKISLVLTHIKLKIYKVKT